jgi:hypothetical protein
LAEEEEKSEEVDYDDCTGGTEDTEEDLMSWLMSK